MAEDRFVLVVAVVHGSHFLRRSTSEKYKKNNQLLGWSALSTDCGVALVGPADTVTGMAYSAPATGAAVSL